MDCDTAREALSARIDGEREPIPAARVDEHVASCGPCRQWQAEAVEQTQLMRRLAGRSQLSAVRPPPERQPGRPRYASVSWTRWALAAVGIVQLSLAIAQAKGGNLRAIGVTSARRSSLAPDWPALAETLPGYDIDAWLATLGPKGLPEPIARRLHEATVRALAKPDVQSRLATMSCSIS